MDEINALGELQKRREDIKVKLSSFSVPDNISPTSVHWVVGNKLGVSGASVKNYIEGKISDGYLAEAIYKELKRLKLTK